MGRKRKKAMKPWCYYCNREFDDEKTLVQHQKARHFKCVTCNKKLFTGPGLAIHTRQVHQDILRKIPFAISGRDDTRMEIYGSDGIPEELVLERQAKHQAMQGQGGRPQEIHETQLDDFAQQALLYAQQKEGQNYQFEQNQSNQGFNGNLQQGFNGNQAHNPNFSQNGQFSGQNGQNAQSGHFNGQNGQFSGHGSQFQQHGFQNQQFPHQNQNFTGFNPHHQNHLNQASHQPQHQPPYQHHPPNHPPNHHQPPPPPSQHTSSHHPPPPPPPSQQTPPPPPPPSNIPPPPPPPEETNSSIPPPPPEDPYLPPPVNLKTERNKKRWDNYESKENKNYDSKASDKVFEKVSEISADAQISIEERRLELYESKNEKRVKKNPEAACIIYESRPKYKYR